MKRILIPLAVVLAVAGCAAERKEASPARGAVPGILIIGTAGPVRLANDEERGEFYRSYVASVAKLHPGEPPPLDAAAFQDKIAGWASIQTSGGPGIVSSRSRVLVPSSARDTGSAPAAGSFMSGTTRDLVVARQDDDGLTWLERVLCRDDKSYRDCAKNYQAGIFDENTGTELDRHRKPKTDGAVVDVTSYVKLPDDVVRHTAAELDMRDSRHCDCNRATPGSVGSTVPTPALDNR